MVDGSRTDLCARVSTIQYLVPPTELVAVFPNPAGGCLRDATDFLEWQGHDEPGIDDCSPVLGCSEPRFFAFVALYGLVCP